MASATSGLFYLTPLRSTVLRSLFDIDGTDRQPVASGLCVSVPGRLTRGHCHSVRNGACRPALVERDARGHGHPAQGAVGLCRALDHRRAGVTDLEVLLGAGGGPAVGAIVLGGVSLDIQLPHARIVSQSPLLSRTGHQLSRDVGCVF